MTAIVAWRGGLFLTEGQIGVLTVSSLFITRVGVYVGVYAHTHTHCTDGVLSCGVRMRHLEGLKNPGGPNLGIYIFVCVQSTQVYVYAKRRDEILD